MLFSYAVRALYIESSAMFVRAGVYRVVKEAMGGTLAKLFDPFFSTKPVGTGPFQFVDYQLDAVIRWLTGYDEVALARHLSDGTPFADFFAAADLNPAAARITGSVCGVRVETIEDPLMQQVRRLDRLVDELAKGRPLEKVQRS